jgi:hypothetical protein
VFLLVCGLVGVGLSWGGEVEKQQLEGTLLPMIEECWIRILCRLVKSWT